MAMQTKEQLFEKLNEVIDPELGVGIVDLGLVYDVRQEDDHIEVEMTLTSGGCPAGPQLIQMVKDTLIDVAKEVDVEIVWDPAWTPKRIKPEVAAILGIDPNAVPDEAEHTDHDGHDHTGTDDLHAI